LDTHSYLPGLRVVFPKQLIRLQNFQYHYIKISSNAKRTDAPLT